MNIGLFIKNKREELNMTMKELSAKVGVSEGTISRWESGEIANMRRDKIFKLSKALNVSVCTLMEWDEPEESEEPSLRLDEQELLDKYNQLDADDMKEVSNFIDYKLSNKKYDRKVQKRNA